MAIMAVICYYVHYKNRNLLYLLCYLSSIMAIIDNFIVDRDNYVHYAHYEKFMQIMVCFCLPNITPMDFQCYYTHYSFPNTFCESWRYK